MNAHFDTVDLGSLSFQQLSSMKKQLDDELEHLTTSFSKLRAAKAKFRECLQSIKSGVTSDIMSLLFLNFISILLSHIATAILIPLTTSLYVPGKLADFESVIVDVGTGFYVEKVEVPAPDFSELH